MDQAASVTSFQVSVDQQFLSPSPFPRLASEWSRKAALNPRIARYQQDIVAMVFFYCIFNRNLLTLIQKKKSEGTFYYEAKRSGAEAPLAPYECTRLQPYNRPDG